MHGGGDKHLCGFCDYDYFGPVVSWFQLQKSRLRQSPECSANKTLAYHNKQTLWTSTLACTFQFTGLFSAGFFSRLAISFSHVQFGIICDVRKEKKRSGGFSPTSLHKDQRLRPHMKVSPSSEILEQTTELQLGAAHTHACIHTRGSQRTQTPCLQS